LKCVPGYGRPFGAVIRAEGVQFTLFSRHATQVWLALFDHPDAQEPYEEFRLDPYMNRIGNVWTVTIEGLTEGALYLYRLAGPSARLKGHRFDQNAYVMDPYARAFAGDSAQRVAKCVVVSDLPPVSSSRRPRVPMSQTIIYEAHVRGLTQHPSGEVKCPGSYRGIVEKIPYFKELGITTLELLPIHEVGEYYLPRTNPLTGETLVNYWGYSSIGFFAPNRRYACDVALGGQVREFRAMVDALHEAGLEVILDVVYNHTSEQSGPEPPQCFQGIDNSIYYMLDDKGGYRDLTGCGNTLNCNHPVVRDLILDSLRYWVTTMQVDGFRFDLAPVLRRDRSGHLMYFGPLVEHLSEDPILREVKLIAEPWDVAGGYLVGSFGGEEWAEWNGQYRDDVRRFWRGDMGMKGHLALRLTGSPDLYEDDGRTPLHSINFITAHDGFTLRDLVSYNSKQNYLNGEDNRDGLSENFSFNCGVDGETDDPSINELRLRLQKNLLGSLFLSLGVPMLLGGDEFGRTQRGNNNAYCQDNDISWFDWGLVEQNQDMLRFCKELIRFRTENPAFTRRKYFTGTPRKPGATADILWFSAKGMPQNWSPEDSSLACWINGTENGGVALYLMLNPTTEVITFTVPEGQWRVRINTALASPQDIQDADSALRIQAGHRVVCASRSLILLSDHASSY
jgi:glycogen operon protein